MPLQLGGRVPRAEEGSVAVDGNVDSGADSSTVTPIRRQ
jgi:hypothetical protein